MEAWSKLLDAIRQMTALEVGATAFSLACVVLTIRRNVWCWPVGIVGIALSAVFLWKLRLYPDVVLQVYFFVLSLYGWWVWVRRGPDDAPLVVSRPSRTVLVASILFIAVLAPLQGWAWKRFSDAAMPYLDSTIMVASVVAQWMLARKWLESWMLWIAVDALAVPVYASRGAYLYALLYFCFLVLAVLGLRQWWRAWRKVSSPSSASSPLPDGSASTSSVKAH